MNHLTKLLEAALYSASRPLTINELKALDPTANKGEVQAALEELRVLLDSGDHGVELVQLAEGYQILTRPEFAEAIADARIAQRPRKLSGAAMETLAIISYRQPVGRAEIEEIRGVAADGVLRSLSERGLIDVAGRGEGLGRPLLYGTTPKFLEMVGLQDVSQLPRLEELSVALTPVVDRLGDDDEERDDLPEGDVEGPSETETTSEVESNQQMESADNAELSAVNEPTADAEEGATTMGVVSQDETRAVEDLDAPDESISDAEETLSAQAESSTESETTADDDEPEDVRAPTESTASGLAEDG